MHINFDLRKQDKESYCRSGHGIRVDSGTRRGGDVKVTLWDHKAGEREPYYAVELCVFGITISVDADADAYADLGEMAAESSWIERTFTLLSCGADHQRLMKHATAAYEGGVRDGIRQNQNALATALGFRLP